MNVPDDLAASLRALGTGFNLAEVQRLYAPLLAAQTTRGARCHQSLPYGPHERHVLDVYAPIDQAGGPAPVLMFFHGGGFVRGDKSSRANIGWYLARHGVVAVVANYRLAPGSRWPSGPEDVVSALGWVREHALDWGGDPDRVVLAGESAGAAHVAAATLMKRFHPSAGLGARGAMLMSGPYDVQLEGMARQPLGIPTPDPRNEAYYGADASAWPQASIVSNIDAPPVPLLISWAERDLLQMQVQAGQLFAELVKHHGFAPELLLVRDHNHFSQTESVNTGDDSVGAPILDFVARHAAPR